MKSFLLKSAVYGALFLAPVVDDAHAFSAFDDGNDLFRICVEAETETDTGLKYMHLSECRGYIVGVSDQMEMTRAEMDRPACMASGKGITKGQVVDVVVKYLKDHPEERHLAGSFIVVKAVESAFCMS